MFVESKQIHKSWLLKLFPCRAKAGTGGVSGAAIIYAADVPRLR
jgi:hypothetical protein